MREDISFPERGSANSSVFSGFPSILASQAMEIQDMPDNLEKMADKLVDRLLRRSKEARRPIRSAREWRLDDRESFLAAHQMGVFPAVAAKMGWPIQRLPKSKPTEDLVATIVADIRKEEALPDFDTWRASDPEAHDMAVQSGFLDEVVMRMGWSELPSPSLPDDPFETDAPVKVSKTIGILKPDLARKLSEGLLGAASHLDGTAGAIRAHLGNACPEAPIASLNALSGDFKDLALHLDRNEGPVDGEELLRRMEELFARTEALQATLLEEIGSAKKGGGFFGAAIDGLKAAAIGEIAKGILVFAMAATCDVDITQSQGIVDAGRDLRSAVIAQMIEPAPEDSLESVSAMDAPVFDI
jgi:hypothetical protein